MNEQKKVSFSILMANYNNSIYIDRAITSVLSQSYPVWELIIVDDNSLDDSVSVIRKYSSDNRIKLVVHERNEGYGASLKTAIEVAKNEIIAILDSDDALYTKALEVMADEYQKNPQYGFIYSTMWRCDHELNIVKVDNTILDVNVNEKNWMINPPISHLKTFKKSVYLKTKGFEKFQSKAVDKDLFYKLSEVTRFKFVNVPLYYYREHSTGISQGKRKYNTKYFLYMAKYKTYQRRLNTDLPNFTQKDLKFFYYYNIVFFNVFRFILNLIFRLRADLLLNKVINLIPGEFNKKKALNLKNKYVDIFG